jgi:uncharacterized integral membrane protein
MRLFLVLPIISILNFSFAEQLEKLIFRDKFDTISVWKTYRTRNCYIKISTATINALKFEYELGEGNWVAIERPVKFSLCKDFIVKYNLLTTGEENYLETKVFDKDGSVFGYKLLISTTPTRKEIVIHSKDFSYWWGGDKNLDDVIKIGFAISKRSGGKGVVEIKDLQILEKLKEISHSNATFEDEEEVLKITKENTNNKEVVNINNIKSFYEESIKEVKKEINHGVSIVKGIVYFVIFALIIVVILFLLAVINLFKKMEYLEFVVKNSEPNIGNDLLKIQKYIEDTKSNLYFISNKIDSYEKDLVELKNLIEEIKSIHSVQERRKSKKKEEIV